MERFLELQNDRLKFYDQSFWAVANFLSAIVLLLLSAPFAVWLTDPHPRNWSVISSAAPVCAVVVVSVATIVLSRTAESYYGIAASVLVLERLLGFHRFGDSPGEATVTSLRFEQAKYSVDDLMQAFKRRMTDLRTTSRMALIIRLFVAYGAIAVAETIVLLTHGIFGVNLVDFTVRLF